VPYGREAHAFIRFLKNWRQTGVDEVMAHAVYDPDYAYMLVRGVRGKIPVDRLQAEVNPKLIRLDEYRKQKYQQSIAGATAAANND
jgi:hypothetical protein